MRNAMGLGILFALALAVAGTRAGAADLKSTANVSSAGDKDGWINMFDGKTLDGWKVSKENADSIKVEDGAIVTHGECAHVYYDATEPFVNFEFEAEVMTKPKSNSGIYFHTKYQDSGWPKYGYECQVNATHHDPKKTASLYEVENKKKAAHNDDEWFKYNIRVEGRHIVIKINDKVELDYTEPKFQCSKRRFPFCYWKLKIGISFDISRSNFDISVPLRLGGESKSSPAGLPVRKGSHSSPAAGSSRPRKTGLRGTSGRRGGRRRSRSLWRRRVRLAWRGGRDCLRGCGFRPKSSWRCPRLGR
jgi:hypothetical protein